MCGIGGLISDSTLAIPIEECARRIASTLRHRGPDSAGYYKDETTLLVHTRLSIIDLAGGMQPIHNEDKTIWVIFNGEIYNFVELRETLEQKGHRFYTKSDTEVLVHLYEEYGELFVNHLNGQFAICLWDTIQQKAMLVRDRVGIAPLFYQDTTDGLFFASEVKAILSAQNTTAELDLEALDQLLTFWAPISPRTIFKGVSEVSPGTYVVWQRGKALRKEQYWDLRYPLDGNFTADSESVAAERVHDILLDATKIRLRSDVPVAAYLSGGLDSSILVSMIHNFTENQLTTFSLGFADKDMDEAPYQQRVVDHFDTDHKSIQCQDEMIATHFLDSLWHIESPIIRTAPIPMGVLSGLVRSSDYKVVLTGEGADEVFGGYDLFKETKLREFWSRNPDSSWRPLLINRLYPYLNLSEGRANQFLQGFFGGGVSNPQAPLFSHLPRMTSTSQIKRFYSQDTIAKLREDGAANAMIDSLPGQFQHWQLFNKAQYIETKSLMGGYLLSSQGDRMLMRNSVEGRFPFLDHRLMEYANTLSPALKMKVLNEKYILKKAAGHYLPAEIVNRYKQPYRAPNIPSFFSGDTPDYVHDLLDPSKVNKNGYFDGKKVSLLVKKIRAGRAVGYKDNMALISILSTQVWHELFNAKFSSHVDALQSHVPIQVQ
ncbi:MAG: asparagine synthase (glutamine-hydrolyzing) [Pseudomonadales bacterium]|nr:asparagine synthase (glutamine-hydrolyzing) [Pseudomonadales bacterium]